MATTKTTRDPLDHDADGKKGGSLPKPTPGKVLCRITKAGDGKVSKGTRTADGDETYAKDERVRFSPQIAADLEERNYVEILDTDAALPDPTDPAPKADPALED